MVCRRTTFCANVAGTTVFPVLSASYLGSIMVADYVISVRVEDGYEKNRRRVIMRHLYCGCECRMGGYYIYELPERIY